MTSAFFLDHFIDPSVRFWPTAKLYQEQYDSPSALYAARQIMGVWTTFVPDGDLSHLNDPKRPTKAEDFYIRGAESELPFGTSISFANLAKTDLPPGAVDMAWAMAPIPFRPPLAVALIGHEKGTRLVSSWREGSVVSREQVKRVHEVFRRILENLGKEVGGEDVTLGKLGKSMDVAI